ncbi:energy-coupling factor ABC transporter permease [Frigidibacter sp. SD6-1]|uniref:energy-coupling factor ABC transporter permease n=1 Tax=Frigidibacter sp. SD6-1 TaxID=3032581 RepID=UPI0024E018A1|nr:energy-coupling factor ABC transporter permease [Frigidibacter sp. SD6-1]
MHIEPGIVDGAKIVLSYATAAAAGGLTFREAYKAMRAVGVPSVIGRTAIATALVFAFFQVLPHFPVGVSEVHFILGSTLFLMFGAAPAALGLALGLLVQGLFFAPFDLPQYGMNVTTILVPLFALQMLAKRIIAPDTAYVDLRYSQALALSTAYQGGVVAWVGFWAFYGQGFGAANIAAVTSFGAAYMMVILIEPLADLAVLAAAKSLRDLTGGRLFERRLHQAA